LIDGQPPSVKIARALGGFGVSVRVGDPFSGVDVRHVSVSFGDGTSARSRTRFVHRFAHAGVYRVGVRVRDRLGNSGVVRQLVGVR
jgi:hypothetical protein